MAGISSKIKHVLHCCLLFTLIFVGQIWFGCLKANNQHFTTHSSANEYPLLIILLQLPRLFVLFGLPSLFCHVLGLVCFNAFPDKVKLKTSTKLAPFIYFRIATKGDFPNLVKETTMRNLKTCINVNLQHFMIEVVSNKVLKIPAHPRIREIVVPSSYMTKSGALFKARTLQYCLDSGQSNPKDNDWIVHLDEETLLTEDSVRGIVNFVADGKHQCGLGVVTFSHDGIKNWLTILIDNVFVAIGMGILRFSLQAIHRPIFGCTGTFMVAKANVVKEITFDFGLDGSVTEETMFSMTAFKKGFTYNFIEGDMWEKSSFNLWDLILQRRRWAHGMVISIAHFPNIPLKYKLFKISNSIFFLATPVILTDTVFIYLFSIPTVKFVESIWAFGLSVYVYSFIYPVLKCFDISKVGVVKYILILFGSICVMPLCHICESIAIIWSFFVNKHQYYVVKKEV